MRTYKIVQTTGNSHAGGESGGFSIMAKVCMLSLVKNEARAPTLRGIAIHITSSFHCIFKKSPPKRICVYKPQYTETINDTIYEKREIMIQGRAYKLGFLMHYVH